jgi:hypothetical protein
VGCGVWSVGCGEWCVVCGVWGSGFGVRGVGCGVWVVGWTSRLSIKNSLYDPSPPDSGIPPAGRWRGEVQERFRSLVADRDPGTSFIRNRPPP